MDKQLLKIKAEACAVRDALLCIAPETVLELLAENEKMVKAIEQYISWSSGGPSNCIKAYENLVKVLNENLQPKL